MPNAPSSLEFLSEAQADLEGIDEHNPDHAERVGNSGYRVIYEISEDVMTVVAVLPKSDDTYDLSALARRASE